MANPASKCRGFTHPVILLIRSSLPPTARPNVSKSGTSPCLRLQQSSRFFASGMRPSKKTVTNSKPLPVVKTTAKAAAPSTRPAASSSYAQALAQRPGGAVLYEGAGQRAFIASSYMAGFTCIGGAALNTIFNVYNVPPGVPEWTAYAFGSVGLMLAILGMNFVLKPANIVRRITLLPAVAAAPKTKGGYVPPAKLQVEVLYRRLNPIPGLPLKKQIVEPRDIVLKSRMYNPRPFGSQPGPTLSQEWIQHKKAKSGYDKEHLMTAPIRDAGWIFSGFFAAVRRGLTGEGFAPIEVKGQMLKLDISNGYILEEGKAMDRVLRIEEEQDSRPSMLFKS
ncbi:hypothetical protein BKA67DRAFT_261932 [Truncatella angustata]|uniref:Uncharacterized protein n=1 Tax=Truncatella angustata TaxID=152316 RepID=A0A9P8ZXC2_9PEZI|nr:uncharacterized protein BKA67DRAFT_261932 [Truncatella angustata]KAH6653839.1 hypothetical protein BKA67DRAFT_261932 [Truncatella angustata]KAH8193981.1 hypothetical protein TruAng_011852 [Truncatella angustata]